MCRRLALAVATAANLLVLLLWAAAPTAHGRADALMAGEQSASSLRGAGSALPARRPGLVFGIYPGGAVGTVGPSGTFVAEDPGKRLAALEELRGAARHFVIRLYASYTGPGGPAASPQIGAEVRAYEAAGFEVELVLAYRPADGGTSEDASGFAEFVRRAVGSFGRSRRFVSLQVANEANVGGAPNASDGSYRDAKDALIAGVIAAGHERETEGFDQLAVGFNWAYAAPSGQSAFWRYLSQHGGRRFARAVGWVGVDIYPGTWGPPIAANDLANGTATAIITALRELRERYMPLAGLGSRVRISVTENGYPTGPSRTPAMQLTALRAAIAAVDSVALAYGVTDYRWFDLRDGNSSSDSFESHYGLLTDDYAPKPAFAVYRHLVARLSAPGRRAIARH